MKNFIHMLKQDSRELLSPMKPFTRWDYIALLLVVAGAFFVFDTASIIQTAGASIGYLNFHFLDFYDYGAECGLTELMYMPAVYLTYAVWNLPLRLFGLVKTPVVEASYVALLWYKLLLVGFYLACVYLVYKIALEIGMGLKKAKVCALAAFTMPVGFFLQFYSGQVMVMPLFFMLLGILYYLRDKRWGFIACFAAAIAYQQYVMVLFFPLLLLKEKRLRYLCENILLAVVPFTLEYLVYRQTPGFVKYVRIYGLRDNFVAGLNNGSFFIQCVVMVWILVLGLAYFTGTKCKKELSYWVLFLTSLTGVVTLCLTSWEAAYFMLLVPFFVLLSFLHKELRAFLVLDMAWGVLMLSYILLQQYDLKGLNQVGSVYTVLLLISVIFKNPNCLLEKPEEFPDVCTGWIRVRFLAGAALCIMPALAGKLLG